MDSVRSAKFMATFSKEIRVRYDCPRLITAAGFWESIILFIVGLISLYARGILKDLILNEPSFFPSNVFAASHEGFTWKSAKDSNPVMTTVFELYIIEVNSSIVGLEIFCKWKQKAFVEITLCKSFVCGVAVVFKLRFESFFSCVVLTFLEVMFK